MDREQREHYQVVIEAKDMAGQRGGLTGTTVVNITLTDVNDNPPRFTQSEITALKQDSLHANDETLSHTRTLIIEYRNRKGQNNCNVFPYLIQCEQFAHCNQMLVIMLGTDSFSYRVLLTLIWLQKEQNSQT